MQTVPRHSYPPALLRSRVSLPQLIVVVGALTGLAGVFSLARYSYRSSQLWLSRPSYNDIPSHGFFGYKCTLLTSIGLRRATLQYHAGRRHKFAQFEQV